MNMPIEDKVLWLRNNHNLLEAIVSATKQTVVNEHDRNQLWRTEVLQMLQVYVEEQRRTNKYIRWTITIAMITIVTCTAMVTTWR